MKLNEVKNVISLADARKKQTAARADVTDRQYWVDRFVEFSYRHMAQVHCVAGTPTVKQLKRYSVRTLLPFVVTELKDRGMTDDVISNVSLDVFNETFEGQSAVRVQIYWLNRDAANINPTMSNRLSDAIQKYAMQSILTAFGSLATQYRPSMMGGLIVL